MDEASPRETVERVVNALNERDMSSLMMLCSFETLITTPDGNEIRGRDAIREWARQIFEKNGRFALRDLDEEGFTVTGILEIANDYHRSVGVAPLEVELTARVDDGRLITFGGPFTEASLEKLRPLREQEAATNAE